MRATNSMTRYINYVLLLLSISTGVAHAEPVLILKGTAVEGALVQLFNIDSRNFGFARVSRCVDCPAMVLNITPDTEIFIDGKYISAQSASLLGKFVSVFYDAGTKTVLKIKAKTPNRKSDGS